MKRVLVLLSVCAFISACGSSSSTSPTPTPAAATTRIINVSGTLAFGNVNIGSTADRTFTISNTGTGPLTYTSLTASGGTGTAGYTASPNTGSISPGASATVTVRFAPTIAQFYSCVLSVVGDQTAGGAAINVSGTGVSTTPAPTTSFTLTGTVTDGTSHGILPNLTVQITTGTNSGRSAVTDGSGSYTIGGLSGGALTLSAAATSYQTVTQQVTLSGNTRIDLVLQRVATTPTPPPAPSNCPNPPYRFDPPPNSSICRGSDGKFAFTACCTG